MAHIQYFIFVYYMNIYTSKTIILIFLSVSASYSNAQNNEDFFRSMIKEGLKSSIKLFEEQSLETTRHYPEYPDSIREKQRLKKKLLLYDNNYYRYDNSDLVADFDRFLKENPYLSLPEELFQPYTNPKIGFDDKYDNTLIFVDGKWVPQGSLLGISSGTILNLLPLNGFQMPKFKSKRQLRKERALKNIMEAYKDSLILKPK